MPKRKNKDTVKRREAKKRRKDIKRRAHRQAATLSNVQTEYTIECVLPRKLSEVILDYAEPLFNASDDSANEEKAISMSIIFWNASLRSKEEALETLEPALNKMTHRDQLKKFR